MKLKAAERSKWKSCRCVNVCVSVCVLSCSRNLGSSPVLLSEWSFSSRPRVIRSGPAGPAVMNRQNSPAQHKGSGLIIGSLMPSDTHTHTSTLIQSTCHPCTWLDERIKVWNEEIKRRVGLRVLLDSPVILSR